MLVTTYSTYGASFSQCPVSISPVAPGSPPANFTIIASGPRSLTFSWEPPTLPHGVIIGYQLSCSPQRPGFPETFNQSTRVEATREGFAPDTTYTCSVFASTGAGDGPSVNRIIRTLEARKDINNFKEMLRLQFSSLSHTSFTPCSS